MTRYKHFLTLDEENARAKAKELDESLEQKMKWPIIWNANWSER